MKLKWKKGVEVSLTYGGNPCFGIITGFSAYDSQIVYVYIKDFNVRVCKLKNEITLIA